MVVLGVSPVVVGVFAELDSLPHRAGGASSTRRGGGLGRGGLQNVCCWGSPLPHQGEGNSLGVCCDARRQLHAEPPRHAEVDRQHLALVEMHQDVFRAALEPGNPAAGETLGKSLGQRKAQILAALLDTNEAATLQHGLEASAHGLDLG